MSKMLKDLVVKNPKLKGITPEDKYPELGVSEEEIDTIIETLTSETENSVNHLSLLLERKKDLLASMLDEDPQKKVNEEEVAYLEENIKLTNNDLAHALLSLELIKQGVTGEIDEEEYGKKKVYALMLQMVDERVATQQ